MKHPWTCREEFFWVLMKFVLAVGLTCLLTHCGGGGGGSTENVGGGAAAPPPPPASDTKADQTIDAIVVVPASPLRVGDSATLSAVASSGLPVNFYSTSLNVCSVDGTMVAAIHAGTCTILARQDGNGDVNPAPPVMQNIVVLAPPIPDGAKWAEQHIVFDIPPPRFTRCVGWFQVATLTKNQAPNVEAKIFVDWVRVIEIDTFGSEVIILQENYDISRAPLSIDAGGLFDRSPSWFETNDNVVIQASSIHDGMLELDAAPTPDNILHWWTPRLPVRPGYRYAVAARVNVVGDISFQMGFDAWLNGTALYNGYDSSCTTSNNCEIFVSGWTGNTHGQFVVVQAPR